MKLHWAVFICLFFALLLIINNLFGGFGVDNLTTNFDRTYTHAICSGQTCRDFAVSCSGKEVVSLTPISGFVTFGDGWVDLREERELCQF